ncbi:MAG: 4-hydroxythreonine-4-phosphate dehydrogenase PdxA [Pseudomonadota bacterium]|jgi:4-hydroxythreonine-4-phosphate dehydrogenase/1,2-dihydroxy-3,5-cyclohexadiene-1,4-dicarboxylate dehydrogenase
MTQVVRKIGLSLGDPNGIGPEIALKALTQLPAAALPSITVFGSEWVWHKTAASLGLVQLAQQVQTINSGAISESEFNPGLVSAAAGKSAVDSATAAIQACQAGHVDAVIACPHHETAIHQAGIAFSGYPSLVAKVCGLKEDDVFLMLVGGGLRIVHVTLHESVQTALNRLSPELIEKACITGIQACVRLGIENPKVAMFGINPHASEGSLFGPEDFANTVPAVKSLQASGYNISGPQGGDVFLAQRQHDLYVAIFHDQGHIPVKLLAPHAASALSIGAQVLLSSVGHGCAMDIAGKNLADPQGLLRTIGLIAPHLAKTANDNCK